MLKRMILARCSGGGPYSRIPGTSLSRLERICDELVFVLLDRLEADRVQVVHGGPEADRLRNRRGTGLELVRQLTPGGLELNLLDRGRRG